MSTTSFAGFVGAILGLLFGLPLAGEEERPAGRPRLLRFSFELKISMVGLGGLRSLRSRLFLLSAFGGSSDDFGVFSEEWERPKGRLRARIPVG